MTLGALACVLPNNLGAALLDPALFPRLPLRYVGLFCVYFQLYLTFKYTRRYGSLCPWVLLVLSNYPVGAAFGWHYDLVGWQFQLPYVAVLLQILWQEVLRPHILAAGSRRELAKLQ